MVTHSSGINEPISVDIREWQHISPVASSVLSGYRFSDSLARQAAEQLTHSGQLEVLELHDGLSLKAFQYVGTLQLGDLKIRILPKLSGIPLLNLFRYAYNLRNLELFGPISVTTEHGEFQDLLIHQLVAEVKELIGRGLHRRYQHKSERLAAPRGKINFGLLVKEGGIADASLPCDHHVRLENNILNQCICAGVSMSMWITSDSELRFELRKLLRILSENVITVPISAKLILNAQSAGDRLTSAYNPALSLIQILFESDGISLYNKESRIKVPGFLFDMNRFFQALVGRFLHENLDGYTVRGEYQLRGMMSYHPQHNPQQRRAPTPRPDFAIFDKKRVSALLDTKYRDIWENDLPRDMLYQLALYAFSQDQPRKATILYPSASLDAKESWIEIFHPINQQDLARVVLRPLNLLELEKVIYGGSITERRRFASQMAFG